MRIAEIEKLDCDFLTVKQISECLHMDQQLIRDQCERDIKWLGFPACRCGHSFRFPRRGFIAWATGMIPMLVYDQRIHQIYGMEGGGKCEEKECEAKEVPAEQRCEDSLPSAQSCQSHCA